MSAPSYREPGERNDPPQVPDYEAVAIGSQVAARRRLQTMLLCAVIAAAIFVCLRFFRMPAEISCGLVAVVIVLSVVSDVVQHRRG